MYKQLEAIMQHFKYDPLLNGEISTDVLTFHLHFILFFFVYFSRNIWMQQLSLRSNENVKDSSSYFYETAKERGFSLILFNTCFIFRVLMYEWRFSECQN